MEGVKVAGGEQWSDTWTTLTSETNNQVSEAPTTKILKLHIFRYVNKNFAP